MPPAAPHIGVIAYEMEERPSGVGRFLEGLLSGVVELETGWRWLLFFKGRPFAHPLFEATGRDGRAVLQPLFDGLPGVRPIAWEQLRLPILLRRHGADAVFSPGYSLPLLSGLPGFLTLHDLAFERRPEEFSPRERWRRRFLARRGARTAARVFASSRFGLDELVALYRVDRERVRVLPGAVAPRFFAEGARSERAHAELAALGVRAPYLLWVGTLLPRRPVEWALAALTRERRSRPDLQLVLSGADRLPARGALAAALATSGVAEAVVRLEFAPEQLLPALYRGAELTLYPSAYEGFGLPPLESLAAGSAVVTTPGQALDDLWPEYPYRAPFEREGFLATVTRALADPRRAAFVDEGRRRVSALTWRATAERLVTEIDAVLARRAGSRGSEA